MIKLTHDTIDKKDLINWLKEDKQLTKGELTLEFEKQWSEFIGVKHSIMVNSGSSANLAMIYSLILSKKLKNNKIIVPALCWATTISPVIQLGLEPIIVDVDLDDLTVNLLQLIKVFEQESPACLFLVHPLGFVKNMDLVRNICNEYNVILIEDSCETVGSTWNNKQAGSFGEMGSFSFYFSHHLTTIEGGMVCTNNDTLNDLLLMIRSHGWTRDLEIEKQEKFREKFNIDEFNEKFTFYIPAFNIRSTDLQAMIGLSQLKNLKESVEIRFRNFKFYQEYLKNDFWKIQPVNDIISNFSYPIIHPLRNKMVKALYENDIECRPIICGNIAKQPAFKHLKSYSTSNADIIHKYGFYLPNHVGINEKDIKKICKIINKVIN